MLMSRIIFAPTGDMAVVRLLNLCPPRRRSAFSPRGERRYAGASPQAAFFRPYFKTRIVPLSITCGG